MGISSDEFLFHQTNSNVYERKCFGLEAFASHMEDGIDGFTHLTNTAAVTFTPDVKVDVLKECVREAWITLRHHLPAIACQSLKLSDPEPSYALRYTVPSSPEQVDDWVNKTVFFTDDITPLFEKHSEFKNGHWWQLSEGHYVGELHISPQQEGWQFSLIFAHNSTDGRNSFATMDLLLHFLKDALEGKAKSISELKWGDEVSRLPPPGAFIPALAETGSPPDLSEALAPPKSEAKEPEVAPPPTLIPWLYAPHPAGGKGDIGHIVKFTPELTAKIHLSAKKNGKTITQVITALSILAHAEASLKTAGKLGDERFKEVSGAFSASTHYLIAWNFINHRHKFSGGYASYGSAKPPPLLTADGVPLFVSMDTVRKSVKLDEPNKSSNREVNNEEFWKLAEEVAAGWAATDTSLQGYIARENAHQMNLPSFNPNAFTIPALIVSSIGDLGRLDLLTAFTPSGGEAKTITVQDVICSVRVRTPPVMNLLYQYDGQLHCHFFSGGEFTTPESLRLVTDAFEEWTNSLIP